MKIEICEQLVASWLKHIEGCQIVETNWRPSPIKTVLDPVAEKKVTAFIAEVKQAMNNGLLDIFKKSTVSQFIKQCEIDVVGVKITDAKVEELYLVDSAFHENGLGYNKPVATVLKKLLRAVVVADLIFKHIPPKVVFVSPKCGPTLKKRLETAVIKLDSVVKGYYPTATLSLVFNEDFYSQIYNPLVEQIDNIADDNDLFLRSIKLSKIAESFAPKPVIPTTILKKRSSAKKSATAPTATPATAPAVGSSLKKIGQYAKEVFTTLLTTGQLSRVQIAALLDKKYCSKTFKLSYGVLADPASFADPKRYYKECILGTYHICSQWTEPSRPLLEKWIEDNGFII